MSKQKSFGDQQFDSELQSQAIVEHHSLEGEHVDALREVLADIGRDLQRVTPSLKELDYKGSFSVHVYEPANLKGQHVFVQVSNPGSCYFKQAEAAGMKLAGDIQMMYRGTAQRKRSGF